MPRLDQANMRLLRASHPEPACEECLRETYKYYCREHDLFFWFGHSAFCKVGARDSAHQDHRIC